MNPKVPLIRVVRTSKRALGGKLKGIDKKHYIVRKNHQEEIAEFTNMIPDDDKLRFNKFLNKLILDALEEK